MNFYRKQNSRQSENRRGTLTNLIENEQLKLGGGWGFGQYPLDGD